MSPRNEPVSKFIESSIVTASKEAPLSQIQRLMRQHGLRYIPIMEGSLPVGLLGAPEVEALARLPGLAEVEAERVMRRKPYIVRSDVPLEVVTGAMVQHSYGAAIVTDRVGSVVGVLTPADILRLLMRMIRAEDELVEPAGRERPSEVDQRPPEARVADHAAGSLE